MFGLIGTAVFGLIVGALAKLVMPGKDPGGLLITMALGIAGAFVGSFLGRAMGQAPYSSASRAGRATVPRQRLVIGYLPLA